MRETPLNYMDSVAVYKLLERGHKLVKGGRNLDSALLCYQEALRECQFRNEPRYKAVIFSYIGSYYTVKLDYPAAIRFMTLSSEAYIHQGQHPIKQYMALSGLYAQIGAYQQSLDIYRKAITKPPRTTVDSYYYHHVLGNAAGSYWELGQPDSASRLYYQMLATTRVADTNHSILLKAYTGLANIQMRLEQWDKTWPFIRQATAIVRQRGDSSEIMNMLGNEGTVYYQQKRYQEAKACHYPALAFARRTRNARQIYTSAFILGAILAKEGQYAEAQRLAKEAYSKILNNGTTADWLGASYLMGCVHTHTGQYAIAKRYLLPAIAYAEKYNNLLNAGDGYDHLSTICAGLGQYKQALYYKNRQLRIQDSFMGMNNAGRIAEVEMKYQTEKKDKLLAQKELQLAQERGRIREKNVWIGSLGGGGLLLALIVAGLYTRKQQKEKLHRAHITNIEKDAEIRALKSKMDGEEDERTRLARDLHDGVVVKFSAIKMNLSVLPEQHQTLEGASDFKRIISRLDEATTELRATAHNLLPDTLLEEGLSEAVYYFCKDIQQSSGLDIDLQYADIPRFQPAFELSVYRIVQELVQNVLKHAAATRALVQMIYNDHLLNITVEDNGRGFDPAATGREGIGLRNLRSRITTLQGYLDLRSVPGQGTSIYMEFMTNPITT